MKSSAFICRFLLIFGLVFITSSIAANAQSLESELLRIEFRMKENQLTIDSLNAAIATGRNQVTGESMGQSSVDSFQRLHDELTRENRRMQSRTDRLREQIQQQPPANRANDGRPRAQNTVPDAGRAANSRSTRPIDRPAVGASQNNTLANGQKPPTGTGTQANRTPISYGPPEASVDRSRATRNILAGELGNRAGSGSARSTRPMNVAETSPPVRGARGSVLGGAGLGVMGVDLAARGLEVYTGERTASEAGSELVADYSTGVVTGSALVGGFSLIGGALGGVPGAILGAKIGTGLLTIAGASSAGERMGESMARYHLQQEAFNQYRQEMVDLHPELQNVPADELDEITQSAIEADYLANKSDSTAQSDSAGANFLDGLVAGANDALETARGVTEQAIDSAQSELEQQVVDRVVDRVSEDPAAVAGDVMAALAALEGGGQQTSQPPTSDPTSGVGSLNDFAAQLLQSNSDITGPEDLPGWIDPPLEEPIRQETEKPPVTPPVGGGDETDFTARNRRQDSGSATTSQPLFVPPLIDNNPWLVSDDDVNSIRQGVNQTIANRVATANYRTDADRQQAARLEGQLQAAEERLRREMEKLERQRQQQINEALIEQQRQRVAAWYRQWYEAQQQYQNHQQQYSVPQSGGHGPKPTRLLQDAPQ